LVSLGFAAGAVLLVLGLWLFWEHEDVVRPPQRTLGEWDTDWKCDNGHTFHAEGQVEPRPCWTCGKPAYPVAYFRCNEHGTFEASARFELDDEGKPKVAYLRLRGGTWVPADEGLRCPKCSRLLRYAGNDPLRGFGDHLSPGGG
jgi:hypothetical protein